MGTPGLKRGQTRLQVPCTNSSTPSWIHVLYHERDQGESVNDPGHPSSLQGNNSGRPYWEWARSTCPAMGGGDDCCREKPTTDRERAMEEERGGEESAFGWSRAQRLRSGMSPQVLGCRAASPPFLPTKQAPLLASSPPVFSLPCSFSQAEALGLPDTPAWNACSRTSLPTLRAMVKKTEERLSGRDRMCC